MSRFFLRAFLLFVIILVSISIFLSYFGIETDKFDGLIKKRANETNKYIKLGFKNTKIHLNPTELNLVVKLQNPKILFKGDEFILSRLDLFLPLKSFFTSDFLLKRAEISFLENDIKDLTKITNIFLPKIVNKKLNKIFHKGKMEGEFIVPFELSGEVGKGYGFSGKISDASINLTKEFSLKNLTTEVNHKGAANGDEFKIIIKKGSIYDLELEDSVINLNRHENVTKIKSILKTKGKLNFSQIKQISKVLDLNVNNFKNINGTVDLKTNINFDVNKKYRIKNFSYLTEGHIAHLEIETEEQEIIKKYLPEYDPKMIFKDNKIKLVNSNINQSLEINGSIKAKDYFNNFKISEIYNYNNKSYDINGTIDLTNSKVKISRLNYDKEYGKKSEINFDVKFILDKYFNINSLNFLADQTKIVLSNIKLNKNFEVNNFEKIKIKTYQNKIKNNDFLIQKSKRIVISGEIFDAQPLLKTLYKKSEKKSFSKSFTSEIKINFDKAITGTNDDVFDIGMIAFINKGSYNKLSLKGNFSEDEIVEMSIYQINKDKKTLQVISDRARPFVKHFDFIKGFEGGKLEYESIISKQVSNSNLIITDFKVSKVPALAQLLTLASLQGIADTLSGEGIRFESFEMKSNSEDNVMNIEDALAMGPAVSILLEGYVDKGKIVSLRGTLVPATKLNSIIASIPLVGDILVGKKTGEGVVGVSFKMKGPPKDIKTTVNPIKTLTPRFIVRAVEKMKRKKKEEAK